MWVIKSEKVTEILEISIVLCERGEMALPPWEVGGMDHHTSLLLPPRGEPGSQERAAEASSAFNGSVGTPWVRFREQYFFFDKRGNQGLSD